MVVGGNVGASFGNVKTDSNVTPVSFQVPPGGPFIPFSPDITGSDREYPSGFIGGGQIGYNWQFSPILVAGLEADFQGALERDTNNLSNPFTFTAPVATGTVVTNYTTQKDWFGTVRGRIGYVWGNGEVMSYLTGGLAYGEVKINGTNTVSAPGGSANGFSVSQAFGHSQVNTGWTVGTGTEGKLLIPGWTYKIEWLYVDLGTLDATGVTTAAFAGIVNPMSGGQVTAHTRFTDTISSRWAELSIPLI